ncbi:MAG TPA: DUF4149 domain-containing protein [Armatimonadota bacterium]|jgi:uncharacterized membrane protein
MRRPILILVNTIYHVCAALWIGSLIGIGAMAAPAAFQTLGRGAGSPAGIIIGEAFKWANTSSFACLAIMLAVGVFELSYRKRVNTKRLLMARLLLTGVALLIVLYLSQQLMPQMEIRRAIGDMASFDRMHRAYSDIARLEVLLGVALIALTNAVNIGPRREGGHPRH